MSPGSVTEIIYFFIAEYSKQMKVGNGGGSKRKEAFEMIRTGEIKDAKTIMLLQYMQINF